MRGSSLEVGVESGACLLPAHCLGNGRVPKREARDSGRGRTGEAIPGPSGLVLPSGAPFEGADVLDRYYEMARTRAKHIVEEAVALAKEAGVQARGEVLDRPASAIELIISFAEGEGVDLIVSGTRGLSSFKKLLVGSVSSGLVSHAPCSVLIVR